MSNLQDIEILKFSAVIKAIHHHLWLESEKAGYDKGLSWAAEDWFRKNAHQWNDYSTQVSVNRIVEQLAEKPKVKKRKAKSYI